MMNGYKYWQEQSNLNNTNCNKEHLFLSILMTSTQYLSQTVSEKLNRDNTKQDISKRGLWLVSVYATYQGLVITLGLNGYRIVPTW